MNARLRCRPKEPDKSRGCSKRTNCINIVVFCQLKCNGLRFLERKSRRLLIFRAGVGMDPKFKAYKTGMDTVLERYPCGRGDGQRRGVVYYLCKCDCGKEFIVSAMNYRTTLILAVARLNQLLKATVPMSGLLGLRTERLYA